MAVLPNTGHHLSSENLFYSNTLNNTKWYQAGLHPNIFCLHNRELFLQVVTVFQGFPDFSGSAHVTTQTNFGAQVTTLFEKVTTFY